MLDQKDVHERLAHVGAGYSITVRLQGRHKPGQVAAVGHCLADCKAIIADINLVESDWQYWVRDFTVHCASEDQMQVVLTSLKNLNGIDLLSWADDTFEIHRGGKIHVACELIKNRDDLSRAYTPGVARVCQAIHKNRDDVFRYTIKENSVAVVSDGTAVLGLGDIGPEAAMPVMEGKAMLFKQFGCIDAYPICLGTKDPEEIIKTVKYLATGFGGINLEDISAPRCFEIEKRLQAELDIPVFHDDQHGTAVVVLAGIYNALKIINKKVADLKIVVSGFGAAGVACSRLLLSVGVKNLVACDRAGAVYRGRQEHMNASKEEMATLTNPDNEKGSLAEVLKGADMFLGVSAPGMLTADMVRQMARDPVIFALANPVPEILPEEVQGIARIIATGRSDYPNQVNNVLCFPGLFRGALDCRARAITEGMKLAAAQAIAAAVPEAELREDNIIPQVFTPRVADTVARKVIEVAITEGVAREPGLSSNA